MADIDLSKYAAGKRLRCEEQVSLLERGVIYTSTGCDGQYVTLAESAGYAGWRVSRFVPVEDETPESDPCAICDAKACNCPGIPCDSPFASRYNSDRLKSKWRLCAKCWDLSREATDEAIAKRRLSPGHAIREPVRLNEAQREAVGKVDKYNPDGLKPEVRLEFEKARRVAMDDKDARSGRRDKLIAALRRDLDDGSRMKAFPHPGRNFALEKWR